MPTLMLALMVLVSGAAFAAPDNCSELALGESRAIDEARVLGDVEIPMSYSIRKTGEKKFTVYFNPRFFTVHAQDEGFNDLWRSKFKACIETKSAQLVRGSAYELSFRMYDATRDEALLPPPPQMGVLITDVQRASMSKWSESISCPTMLHETLHHTGLSDEYYEPGSTNRRYRGVIVSKYPRRPIEYAASSIMAMGNGSFLDWFRPLKLYPSHIRHILYPNCVEKNRLYYRCTENAYSEYGSPSDIPPECRSTAWIKD